MLTHCCIQRSMWHKWALGTLLIGSLYVWHAQRDRHALTEAQLHERGLWRSPKLAVDAFVVRHEPISQRWDILLIQRTREPYKEHWALPGGFVSWMEDPVAAVVREVAEETHLEVGNVPPVEPWARHIAGTHQADPASPPVFVLFRGSPTRDPRTHTVRYACCAHAPIPTSNTVDVQRGVCCQGDGCLACPSAAGR